MTPVRRARRVGDGPLVKWSLIGIGIVFAIVMILLPVATILDQAFSEGLGRWLDLIGEPDMVHAIWLTTLTALVVVPVNTVFGIAAAWAITRFRFTGRRLLQTLIELPFSISPIVAGTTYLFLYGAQSLLGPWLEDQGIRIMFTVPAIFLASAFVTAPFVARELITTMAGQGIDDEEAAISLGAPGFAMFVMVTLPNIRWALLYGVILCNARVMGEFGAVSVVAGSIRGVTNTLPLHIELLFNDYNVVGAFAAASTLTAIALLTLIAKLFLDSRR